MNRYRNAASRLVILVPLLALPRLAGAEELRLDARALYEKSVTQHLRLSADGTAIELEQGELFEDDGPAAGFSYRPNEERLSQTTWIKKEFVVPNPSARRATLLVGPGGNLQAIINGTPQPLKRDGKAGNYWEAYDIPPEALRLGKNDIVLHGGGKVWIARDDEFAAGSRTRTKHPNRSARSTDGGKTWDYGRLGTQGNVDGEYYVRLFLEHCQPRGTLTLPVLDVGNLGGRSVAAPLMTLGPVRVSIKADAGAAGQTAVRVRSGTTLQPGAKTWTGWQDLGPAGGVLPSPAGRFVQVALDLATSDPLHSPALRQIAIDAAPRYADDWTRSLRVKQEHNPAIVRTSIPFEYEPFDHPSLKMLRTRYKLDEEVKGAKSEFELIGRLAAWSSRQWTRGHLREAYPAWNALDILQAHSDGTPVGGFCQQYNLVFLQACASFGIPARAVSLSPGSLVDKPRRSGHEVVEVWSNDHKKWIYVDGDLAWYAVDHETAVPLSLWELRQRQLNLLAGRATTRTRFVKVGELERQKSWEGLEHGVPFCELRLIPRSNFLDQKSPLPLNQGMRGWFWTGHHVWTDTLLPAALLYGNRITHRSNWEWTLNQAHLLLEATAAPGELRAHLDTETPGFATFLADIDGKGRQPITSGFLWKLHKGTNRLEVQPRNTAGRDGIASWIVVEHE